VHSPMPKAETRQHQADLQPPGHSGEGMNAHLERTPCDQLAGSLRHGTSSECNGLAHSARGRLGGKTALELGQIMAGLAAVLIIPTGQHLMANILKSSVYGRIGTLDGRRGVETDASCQEE
jgi:hypothetical protein